MPPPRALAALQRAQLSFRGRPPSAPLDLSIAPHGAGGGHALLGENGCGKTLASLALMGEIGRGGSATCVPNLHAETILHGGTIQPSEAVSRVSFESHKQLLSMGGTVYRSLGALGPAARYLIVRFGLHPVLFRPIASISSGEIKKVLLVKALASRPELLVLDNAFDGLDVPSRNALKELVSQTLCGFSQILVQGVDASSTARTQILMMTHRREEMVPELSTISVFGGKGELSTAAMDEERLEGAVGGRHDGMGARIILPESSELADVWGGAIALEDIVTASGLSLTRENSKVLQSLDWKIRPGEHWLIAGGNGAGKSSLSRLLAAGGAVGEASERGGVAGGSLTILGQTMVGQRAVSDSSGVGWVSTERHLREAAREDSASAVLSERAKSDALIRAVSRWLRLDGLLPRPFRELSQGEQKLVLIGAAVAEGPRVLIVDEPCTGLDATNRARVLGLFEALARAELTSLVYITHHPEEVLPCISHVLHLRNGGVTYMGDVDGYQLAYPIRGAN